MNPISSKAQYFSASQTEIVKRSAECDKLIQSVRQSLLLVKPVINLNEFGVVATVIHAHDFPFPIEKEYTDSESLAREEFLDASSQVRQNQKHTLCLVFTSTSERHELFAQYLLKEYGIMSKNYTESAPVLSPSRLPKCKRKTTGSGTEIVSAYVDAFRFKSGSNTAVSKASNLEAPRLGGILFSQGNKIQVLREFALWASTEPAVLYKIFSEIILRSQQTIPSPVMEIISGYAQQSVQEEEYKPVLRNPHAKVKPLRLK